MKTVALRPGRERSLRHRHPWVFEASIASGRADAGETVRVQTADGAFAAWAAFSPRSAIRLRAWSFIESERIDRAFFERRIGAALALRERLNIASDVSREGVRLVHGEADGLPGLVVDRYADTLSAQFLSAGAERWKDVIADVLLQATQLGRLYERSDATSRALEGLAPATGWLRGDGPTEVRIQEHGLALTLDVAEGHKTGFYLDQRDSRRLFRDTVQAMGLARVLNCYCYTGGFSLAALAGGAAHVTSIDSSAVALARAVAHVAANGFGAERHTALDADVNKSLRSFIAQGRRFDAIVLDPPKFAPTAAHADRAARAYKDINRLALTLLAPGGVLFTFSCSGGIDAGLFHKIVAGAGIDAEVDAAIIARTGAAPDHPVTLAFPQSEYLKGLMLMARR